MPLPWDFRPLAGERVTLDLLNDGDFDALYTMQSDEEVCRYLLYEPRSREKVRERLDADSAATHLAAKGDYLQPALRDDAGTLLGTMYFTLTSVEDASAEIGWMLSPAAQGRGYVTEAAGIL